MVFVPLLVRTMPCYVMCAHPPPSLPSITFPPIQGGRTAEDIANYMIKKSGTALSTISSVEEAEAFFAKHPKAALGMFDSLQSPAALGLAAYADKSDSFPLACTVDAAVLAKYQGGAGSLRFVTPEGVFSRALDFTFTEAADGELSMWLFGHSIPSLVQFSAEKSMELFSGPIRVHLIAFGDEATAGYGAMVAAVKEGAGKHRTEALSILVGKNETRILEAFELTEADVPKVVIADMRAGSMKRFFFEGDLTKAGEVEAFLADFLAGNLKAKLKSEEPAPEDMAGPVKVIKGKSFQAQVLDSDKDVLIEFYAPWCGHWYVRDAYLCQIFCMYVFLKYFSIAPQFIYFSFCLSSSLFPSLSFS